MSALPSSTSRPSHESVTRNEESCGGEVAGCAVEASRPARAGRRRGARAARSRRRCRRRRSASPRSACGRSRSRARPSRCSRRARRRLMPAAGARAKPNMISGSSRGATKGASETLRLGAVDSLDGRVPDRTPDRREDAVAGPDAAVGEADLVAERDFAAGQAQAPDLVGDGERLRESNEGSAPVKVGSVRRRVERGQQLPGARCDGRSRSERLAQASQLRDAAEIGPKRRRECSPSHPRSGSSRARRRASGRPPGPSR